MRHVIGYDTGDLDHSDEPQEEVDCCEAGFPLLAPFQHIVWTEENLQDVSWLDDKAPSSPDGTGASKGNILC